MTKFLITGGAGFIGSHIAEEIVKRRLGELVVLDDLSSGHLKNLIHLKGGVSLIQGDIRNIGDLNRACEGADVIFHEAAFVFAFDSYNKPELTNEINVGGTRNVLEAAQRMGVRRVVLASSAAIYGPRVDLPNTESMKPDPESPYAISKLQNEIDAKIFAEEKGVETVCLRYFNVYGPRQDPSSEYSGVITRFFDDIERGRNPTIYGDGRQTRDFIFVGDAARANILAAESDRCGRGEVVNVATGEETSLLQLIYTLEKAFGRKANPVFRPARDGDIKRSVAKTDLAEELLNFKAEVSFVSGIETMVRRQGVS